jgi:hypothetical protein
MKRVFQHEHHNRQDKALKPDYNEEMLPCRAGNWSGMSAQRATAGNYIITIHIPFDGIKPAAAAALKSVLPEIDLGRLTNAVRSELGNHKSTFHRATNKLAPAVVARESQRLFGLVAETTAGWFLKWHNSVSEDEAAKPPPIPARLRPWLQKMLMKPTSAPSSPPGT